MEAASPVITIQELVKAGRYRVRSYVVRHMIEEGFDENQLIEALTGKVSMLEEYEDEKLNLVLGYFHFSSCSRSALHIVCDLSLPTVVDVVTAYIPQRPWWINPRQRGKL